MSTDTITPPPTPSREAHVAAGMRADIQALRALAVLGVLAFHIWPGWVPGGFVGVDVFFVISGYLITSHLLKKPPTQPRDFGAFWAKRILRLLPAVFVVIVATLVAIYIFLPSAQWMQLAREAITSTFYVQNWQLIADATDYLDAHRAPSPFQHFWSLSVEEQYYIGWPFIVAILTWLGIRAKTRGMRIFTIGFSAVALASLVLSIVQTHTSPAVAYFSTFTRIWELAIGSILASVYPWLSRQLTIRGRMVALWLGLAGVVASYLLFSGSMPFPGFAAALPTLATALIILANDPVHRFNPRVLSHSAPIQRIGDWSYALYLWHWPLIIITPYAVRQDVGLLGDLLVVAASIALAGISTHFVEAPIRGSGFFRGHTGRIFALGLSLSLVVTAAALALHGAAQHKVSQSRNAVEAALNGGDRCVGAAAMAPSSKCKISGSRLLTTPAYAKADVTSGIKACLNWPPFPKHPIVCHRGDTSAPKKRIALFGNSHAGQWTEALSRLGRKHNWQVDTYIMGACLSSVDPQSSDCNDIVGQGIKLITDGKYDAVVAATYDVAETSSVGMYSRTIKTFVDSGANVLVIRDTPAPWDQDNIPADCIDRHPNNFARCAGRPGKWIKPDLLYAAAKESTSKRVSTVDMNKYMCTAKTCPSVIGGVIVFSDYNHLSKTFSRTLAPYLEPAVVKALQ